MLLRKTEVAATYESRQFPYTYTQQILLLHYTEKEKVDIVQKRRRKRGRHITVEYGKNGNNGNIELNVLI